MKYILVILLATLMLWSCAAAPEVDYPADVYIANAREYMADEDYVKAAEQYELAVLNATTPEEAMTAQRGLGDAYYADEKYIEAIAAYEVYNDIYFDAPDAAEILYRLGMSYSRIAESARRDQSFTQSSVEFFTELLAGYPEDFERLEARPEYMNMRNRLAEHEYQVGRFYMRTKKPDSAVQRFLYLLRHYPDSDWVEETYVLLIEASLRIPGRYDVALAYYEELQQVYPENKELRSLKKKIDDYQTD